MFLAAAFCPQPPLLHPEVLGTAGQDMGESLLVACSEALDRILTTDPASILVLGSAATDEEYGPGDSGDLFGYGVPIRLGFDGPPAPRTARLPLPHTLGAWLLDTAGFTGQRLGLSAGTKSPRLAAARVDEQRWAMLVMGDGSARRTEKSPGWYDADAVAIDDAVIEARSGGDGNGLVRLDRAVGERVLAAGLPAWHTAGEILADTPMTAQLHYADVPFGVCYVVASWVEADR